MKTLKTLKKISHIAIGIVIVLLISNCSKEENNSPQMTIYTAGYSTNSKGIAVPCYWGENGEHHELDPSDPDRDGYAFDIQVVGDDIYIGGFTTNSQGVFAPHYWKNGERTDLPVEQLDKEGKVTSIYVFNNTIFSVGYVTNNSDVKIPRYWIDDNQFVDLDVPESYQEGGASEIYVTDSKIYTAGYITNSEGVQVPCYWTGKTPTVLPLDTDKDGYASAIYVINDDTYIVGNTTNESDVQVPCYWINGDRTDLPVIDETKLARAFDLHLEEDIIYAVGYTAKNSDILWVPCYWRDNYTDENLPALEKLPVLDETKTGAAYDIQVVDDIIYTAGITHSKLGARIPCYWENKEIKNLSVPYPGEHGEAYDIHVVKE